jgi:hypothetical protein
MNQLLLSATGAAATGAFVLVSPSGWSPRVRWAYVVVPSVLLAGGSSFYLSRLADRHAAAAAAGDVPAPEAAREAARPFPQRHPVTVRVTVPLALGVACAVGQVASLRIDAALERGVVRLGAKHPRRWMAALAVAASLGIDAAGARATTRAGQDRPES